MPAAGITVNYNITEVERRNRAEGGPDEGELPFDFVASENEGDKSIVFASGETTKTITIPTVADSLHEEGGGDTNYLRATVLAGNGYAIGTATAQLDLNEGGQRPVVSWKAGEAGITVKETDGHVVLVLEVTEPFTHPAQVHYVTQEGTAEENNDYRRPSSSTTDIQPGQTEAEFTVPIVHNIQLEDTEAFKINIYESITDPRLLVNPTPTTVKITDHDTVELAITSSTLTVDEGDQITVVGRPKHKEGISRCHITFALYYE